MSAAIRGAERLVHQRTERLHLGRGALGLDDQQRLPSGVSWPDQQEARPAAERVELVGHVIGLKAGSLLTNQQAMRGNRDLLHPAQRGALAAGIGAAGVLLDWQARNGAGQQAGESGIIDAGQRIDGTICMV